MKKFMNIALVLVTVLSAGFGLYEYTQPHNLVKLEIATESGTRPAVYIPADKVNSYVIDHKGGDVVYINDNYTQLVFGNR